jgi:predicted nuclease with TOPRIM domain
LKSNLEQLRRKATEIVKERTELTSKNTALTAKMQGMQRDVRHLESDLNYHKGEAEKYKNQVYSLQVALESTEERLSEQLKSLDDKLKLIEAERDALRTSLQEEEVLRIAAEGRIPLPAATNEEDDEFGSPIRSPRKQRRPELDENDKENVAPKKATVELKLLQQELASERRLRDRAQEQINFMKME